MKSESFNGVSISKEEQQIALTYTCNVLDKVIDALNNPSEWYIDDLVNECRLSKASLSGVLNKISNN